jgi:hypothetical protein
MSLFRTDIEILHTRGQIVIDEKPFLAFFFPDVVVVDATERKKNGCTCDRIFEDVVRLGVR